MHPEARPLPLSALNHYLYCERRAYLIHAERVFVDNEHTLLGNLAHAAVDTPGYEHRAGWELLRALPLFSDTLGLSGKADLVEIRRDPTDSARIAEARPVEYKKGPARRWANDHVQLCAQALCLEEMFGLRIDAGLIFHVASALRTEVAFDDALRALTVATLSNLRSQISNPTAPPAQLKPQCDGCSLRGICMPEATTVRRAGLFEPRDYA
ncbi:MAG: CRISPR-associated protein Cas4 [Undibacterium sp.]|nr:CRISPR-associated protein Cas4 [Opitutaceae bacterium]